jgi:drug/metabolite transporter (DMT)-like permease
MLYVAIFGTLLAFGLFFVGVNYIRSTRATITSTLEPISAGIIAFLLLGETLELPQVIGGGLVIAAVVLLQLRAEKDLFTPELIRSGNRDGEGQA